MIMCYRVEVVAAIAGFQGPGQFPRFREILIEAKQRAKAAANHARVAALHVVEMERSRDKSRQLLEDMNAETAVLKVCYCWSIGTILNIQVWNFASQYVLLPIYDRRNRVQGSDQLVKVFPTDRRSIYQHALRLVM